MYGSNGRTRITQAATALLLLLAAISVHAQQSAAASHLHLKITRNGNFEVFASRAKSRGETIGIALFGAVGLGIVMATKNASDSMREKQVVPKKNAATCRYAFEQALYDQLGKNGFVIQTEPDEKLPVLEVAIVACGFRPLNRNSEEMSAFFESKFRLTQAGERRSRTPQRHFEMDKLKANWSEFENSPTLAANELHQVLTRAGQKLSTKIVYARKN